MAYLRSDPPAFVFVVHPRDTADLYNAPGGSLIRQYSADQTEFCERMLTLPPTFGGEVTFGFEPIRGETLVVFRMPETIMFSGGRDEIEAAVRIAAGRGASVIGLGALTAPATKGGLYLVPKLPPRVTLTTGNAFTAAVARRNVVEASEAMELGTDAVVAVVGCTGSVGVATCRLLDLLGHRLVLIGRSATRVRKELSDLAIKATVSGSIVDAAGADIIVLVTGDPTARIPAELPKPGSVVIDLAHPVNILPEEYPAFARRGIQVVQGGLVHIPGYHCALEMRLPDDRSALACLTETYLFAKAGITEHAVGQATVPMALELEEIAARYGIRARPLGIRHAAAVG